MDCKTDYELVIYDIPEPAKNDTPAPSPTPRNTGNTENLNKLLQLAIRVENI